MRNLTRFKFRCLGCLKSIIPLSHKGKGKYCSSQCQNDVRYREYIEKWKSGKVDGGRAGDKPSSHIRRYLFAKYKDKCCLCGWSKINKFSGTIPLIVDHIDGNSGNSKEKNLRLICPNCDSMTSTYKNLNRGYGRKSRRERYQITGHS